MSDEEIELEIEATCPEGRALLRLLCYAIAEARSLQLEDCAELIEQAVNEVRHKLPVEDGIGVLIDRTRMH